MANSSANLKDRIHRIKLCAEIPALQAEAEGYVNDNDRLLGYFIHHWGRELNKKSQALCGVDLYSPFLGGGQPYTFEPNYVEEYILMENDDFILQENDDLIIKD